MEKLFTKEGKEFTGKVLTNEKGKPVYSKLVTCGRCGGSGHYSYCTMYGTTCFQCHGRGNMGYGKAPLYTAEKLAKLVASKEKRRAKKEAERMAIVAAKEAEAAAKLAGFMAEHGALVEKAKACAGGSSFLTDLVEKLEKYGNWSEKQIAVVGKIVAEIAETAAKKAASGHVGEVGKRIEIKVAVERVASYRRASYFRGGEEMVWITTMRDAAGNAIVTKTPNFHAYKGESFTLRATVKEHSEYNGEKQTVMMRPKIVGEIEGSPTEKEAA